MAVPMIEGALFVAGQLHASGGTLAVRRLRSGVGHPAPGTGAAPAASRAPVRRRAQQLNRRRAAKAAADNHDMRFCTHRCPPPVCCLMVALGHQLALTRRTGRYRRRWFRQTDRCSRYAPSTRPRFPAATEASLSKAVRFFQMWVTGEDKVADAERLIFADAFRYRCGLPTSAVPAPPRTRSDAGPQIGRNAQIARSLMQGSSRRPSPCGRRSLRLGNGIVVKMGDQPVGGGPCIFFRFAHNDMQTNAVLQVRPRAAALAHHRQLLRHQFRGSPHVR